MSFFDFLGKLPSGINLAGKMGGGGFNPLMGLLGSQLFGHHGQDSQQDNGQQQGGSPNLSGLDAVGAMANGDWMGAARAAYQRNHPQQQRQPWDEQIGKPHGNGGFFNFFHGGS